MSKTFDFLQTGGFPFDSTVLSEMQNAYKVFNSFGALFGNKRIIQGCVKNGSVVSDGFIYLNGELIEFKEGNEQQTIIISEIPTEAEFENGETKTVSVKKEARFGTGVEQLNWSDFKRVKIAEPIYKEVKWVGTSITTDELPEGWYIANGQNGTDNILGRMIVGFDPDQQEFNSMLKIGGSKSVTLNNNQIPNHSHTVVADSDFGGGGTTLGLGGGNSANKNVSTSSAGGGQPHENLPPYIVMLPIQFLG